MVITHAAYSAVTWGFVVVGDGIDPSTSRFSGARSTY
jgi:hypothetical protein